jgi:hypothetical protein
MDTDDRPVRRRVPGDFEADAAGPQAIAPSASSPAMRSSE